MVRQMALGVHFVRELLSRRYEYARLPEPDLVMDNPDNVREYRDAGLATGNGSSIYLFNQLLLSPAIRAGMTVVDLACGPANLLVELATLHPDANFVGIDLSEEMLRWAERLKHSKGASNVQFLHADITAISSLQADCADLVMSTLSLHHLPNATLLEQCFSEIARILKPGGSIHLMDFASLKRRATAQYFAYQRTKGLGEFLAKDYEYSMLAAYRREDFEAALPRLKTKATSIAMHSTFGVPFLVALTTLRGASLMEPQRDALAEYWGNMLPEQRADFNAMRSFFRLGGLTIPHPKAWAKT